MSKQTEDKQEFFPEPKPVTVGFNFRYAWKVKSIVIFLAAIFFAIAAGAMWCYRKLRWSGLVKRFKVKFDRIVTPKIEDPDEVYKQDIRKVLSTNSLKDALKDEDMKLFNVWPKKIVFMLTAGDYAPDTETTDDMLSQAGRMLDKSYINDSVMAMFYADDGKWYEICAFAQINEVTSDSLIQDHLDMADLSNIPEGVVLPGGKNE